MARTCKINSAEGAVVIKLSINNALISGGDFKVYDFNSGAVIETFKLHTNSSGIASYQLITAPSNLIGQVLSWQIITCAPVITNSGTLSVEIFQNDILCLTSPLASYNLTSVPNCSTSTGLPVNGGLHFQ